MHSINDNIEFMPYDDANEFVDKRFESLPLRYQRSL